MNVVITKQRNGYDTLHERVVTKYVLNIPYRKEKHPIFRPILHNNTHIFLF